LVFKKTVLLVFLLTFNFVCFALENNPFKVQTKADLSCVSGLPNLSNTPNTAWDFRVAAECFNVTTYYASNTVQDNDFKEFSLSKSIEIGEYLVKNITDQGVWWQTNSSMVGDPNINRFVLGAFLDGVFWLRKLPEGEIKWLEWKSKLELAVNFQVNAYAGHVDWDWGAKVANKYVNQDVYFLLIMGLASELYHNSNYEQLALQMLNSIKQNQLPDGGFHYIQQDNDSPVYHGLVILMLGRFYTLTHNEMAYALIKNSVKYWPLVMTNEGIPESWSDVWMKQTWLAIEPASMVITSAATGDALNYGLLMQSLKSTPVNKSSVASLYAMPFWDKLPANISSLPNEFIWKDENIRGMHGRKDNWYFGFTQGRGLRNSFVGGIMGDPSQTSKTNGIFRGAQVSVFTTPDVNQELFLSDINDHTSMTLLANQGGAVCANYALQSNQSSTLYDTSTAVSSNWWVTQLWRVMKEGSLGLMSLSSTSDLSNVNVSVAFKFLFDNNLITQVNSDTWVNGSIKIKIYHNPGTVSIKNIPSNPIYPAVTARWNGIELAKLLTNVSKNDKFFVTVWVGPVSNEPPISVDVLPDSFGFSAVWADGHQALLTYNISADTYDYNLPWSAKSAPIAIAGEAVKPLKVYVKNAKVSFTGGLNQCVIVESNTNLQH
jgi:hypothetical protein